MSPRHDKTVIGPQSGPQTRFHATPADIAIYGGAAGGGKSYALLMEPLRHVHNPGFGGVIFRRTSVQIRHEGSLWDTSFKLYPTFGGQPMSQSLTWRFPSSATVSMSGMEHDKDRFEWQSAQIPYLAFDELTHFSAQAFWYMQSRSRSTCGVRPYTRAACNPDPDSWVKKFIQWWLDGNPRSPGFGFPIKGRAGVVRWFVRIKDRMYWAFSAEELEAKFGKWNPAKFTGVLPISVTFIPASVYDNPRLLERNPGYLGTLMSLPDVERQQLLDGNWEVRPSAGTFFRRNKCPVVGHAPPKSEWELACRYWDRAATPISAENNDPDATVGVLVVKAKDGFFYIVDVQKMFEGPSDVNKAMLNMAKQDGHDVEISFMQDPGSAGVYEAQETTKWLAENGFTLVSYAPATGDKKVRAKPSAKLWDNGLFKMVEAPWNDETFRILENFPGGKHDDEVDGLSGATERLTTGIIPYVA